VSAIVAAASANLSDRAAHWVTDATGHSAIAGPDAQTVRIGPRCALGHALLRIAAEEPSQPLSRDGRVWLTADVRLDDRARLISALRAHGRGRTDLRQSDPELLLAAYETWGEAFLEHLAGDFAFVLWDEDRGTMLCARDQIGVVPLHYAQVGGELLVATGVEPLLLHDGVADDLDEEALADFLVRARGDFGSTAFRAIRRVPPAHVLRWTATDPTARLHRYWRAPEWEPLVRFRDPRQYVSCFRELLQAAVADRFTGEQVSVQLSGGMDSTTVAALAHRVTAGRDAPVGSVRAINAVLGGATGDREGHYARLVADALQIELDQVDASELGPLDPFAEPQPRTPEPTPYRWTAWDYELPRRSADHARVSLSGLGGDPLLMFVPWYWAEWIAHGQAPRLARALVDDARLFGDRPHPHLKQCAVHAWASVSIRPPSEPGWLAADFSTRTEAKARLRSLAAIPASAVDVRSLTGDPMWSTMFMWGDPSHTRLPLRVRHPFVDLRLLEFVARLPPYPWLISKRILREAAGDLLPEAVRRRPKTPLVRPPNAGIAPEAIQRVADLVRTTPEVDRFLDRQALMAATTTPDAEHEHEIFHELARPLGLVHWLAHRRRFEVRRREVEVGEMRFREDFA